MRTFNFTLSVQVDAKDREQAIEIAKACQGFLESSQLSKQPFKLRNVEVDNVEEW